MRVVRAVIAVVMPVHGGYTGPDGHGSWAGCTGLAAWLVDDKKEQKGSNRNKNWSKSLLSSALLLSSPISSWIIIFFRSGGYHKPPCLYLTLRSSPAAKGCGSWYQIRAGAELPFRQGVAFALPWFLANNLVYVCICGYTISFVQFLKGKQKKKMS
jgi:hypothetical protein